VPHDRLVCIGEQMRRAADLIELPTQTQGALREDLRCAGIGTNGLVLGGPTRGPGVEPSGGGAQRIVAVGHAGAGKCIVHPRA